MKKINFSSAVRAWALLLGILLFVSGCKVKGGESTTTTTGKVPSPVAADRSAIIQWAASSGVVQGYKIEGSADGVKFIELGNIDGVNSGVQITGLYAGIKLYFRVRSYNQGGNSAYTPVVAITP